MQKDARYIRLFRISDIVVRSVLMYIILLAVFNLKCLDRTLYKGRIFKIKWTFFL